MIDVNVTGTWNTVMAGAQLIVDGGRGGSIILISSAAGVKLQPFMIHYTASKHAVTGMARAFAAELGKHSIRVNSVHPGPVVTAMGSPQLVKAMAKAAEADDNHALLNVLTPFLPTWVAQPEDIADAVCWLAGDESKMVTAQAISVHPVLTSRFAQLLTSSFCSVLTSSPTRQPKKRTIDSATAAGLSEPSISTVMVTVACTAPSS